MSSEATEILQVPGLRVRHPSDARVDTTEMETRRYRIRRVQIRSPWLTSRSDPGAATRYEIRILVFEDPDGEPVGDLLEEGRVPASTGQYELVDGTVGGRDAVLRAPADPNRLPRAAYVTGARRFFFVEWSGPAEEVLETLELENG